MKIHTYHDRVPEMPGAEALVDLWCKAWRAEGWDPVVLSREHAKQHPHYGPLIARFRALPTVNPPDYELACYLRWVAMDVAGGGWMSDADVMPYGFTPDSLLVHCGADHADLCLAIWSAGSAVPCLVSGTPDGYAMAARTFAEHDGPSDYINDRPHTSDMYIVQANPCMYVHRHVCVQHGAPGWDTAPAVHYSHGSMRDHSPRTEWIPKLRQLKCDQ